MRLERGTQHVGMWDTGKTPNPNEMPFVTACISDCQFISGNMERGAFPSIGGLDLDQAFTAVRLEAGNVKAMAIPVLNQCPTYPIRQILPTCQLQRLPFTLQREFFTGFAECSIGQYARGAVGSILREATTGRSGTFLNEATRFSSRLSRYRAARELATRAG